MLDLLHLWRKTVHNLHISQCCYNIQLRTIKTLVIIRFNIKEWYFYYVEYRTVKNLLHYNPVSDPSFSSDIQPLIQSHNPLQYILNWDRGIQTAPTFFHNFTPSHDKEHDVMSMLHIEQTGALRIPCSWHWSCTWRWSVSGWPQHGRDVQMCAMLSHHTDEERRYETPTYTHQIIN